ncbi:uncharacterized protein LOC144861517 [Branchiostoma floridae x Branchiostoma japonicum]
MGKILPGVLMFLLVILKVSGSAEIDDCNSSCLDTCNCAGLGLTSVPQDLPTDITNFALEGNSITALSQSDFSQYSRLQVVSLMFNKISEISSHAFANLSDLNEISLSDNLLTTLRSDMFTGLDRLVSLHLDNNDISGEIQAGTFDPIQQLTNLQLHFNKIDMISPETFASLRNLQFLNLGHNKLSTIPIVGQKLRQLSQLDLSGNNITNVPVDAFSNLPKLRNLSLSSNRIPAIASTTFNGLINLRELYLDNNQITELPDNLFSGLSNLNIINLIGNSISYMHPNTFSGKSHLDQLLLNVNQMTRFPTEELSAIQSISTLDLRDNLIPTLPWEAYGILSSIPYVDIENNPWQCDCRMFPFRLQMTGSHPFENQINCSEPRNAKNLIEINPKDLISACVKPKIVRFGKTLGDDNVMIQGENLRLVCEASGIPTPDITVTSGQNATVESGGRVTVDVNGAITITDVTAADAGLYVCIAVNHVGSTFDVFSVVDRESSPTFSLPMFVVCVSGAAVDTLLIVAAILTIWCKTCGKARSVGPDTSVVSNNTNPPSMDRSVGPDTGAVNNSSDPPSMTRSAEQILTDQIFSREGTFLWECTMGKILPGVLMFLLVILKVSGSAEIDDCNSSCLDTCNCAGLGFPSVPQDLPTDITGLALEGNSITALSQSDFSQYSALEFLNLMSNKISEISIHAFANLSDLNEISLSYNLLTTLRSDMFTGLDRLVSLHLDNNNISGEIQFDTFDEIQQLTNLQLHFNKIDMISPETFASLRNLQFLNLGHNKLSTIPIVGQKLRQLSQLDLSGNNITNVLVDAFSNLPKLRNLSLSSNRIPAIASSTFNGLINLRELYLDNNQITELPDNLFSALSNLNIINLIGNSISDMYPNTFSGISHLHKLLLNVNQITRFPTEELSAIQSISTLDLRDNLIPTLPWEAYDILSSIPYVDIENNPWECDCRMFPFRLQMTGSHPFENKINCSKPRKAQNLIEINPKDLISACVKPKIVRFENILGEDNFLIQGEPLRLVCEASGIPTPDITVTLPSGQNATVESDGRVTVDVNGIITITDVTAADAGPYVCIAVNHVGSTFDVFSVVGRESSPTFSLPMFVVCVSGAAAGTLLLVAVILTVWCKTCGKARSVGPDTSVVYNNTNPPSMARSVGPDTSAVNNNTNPPSMIIIGHGGRIAWAHPM